MTLETLVMVGKALAIFLHGFEGEEHMLLPANDGDAPIHTMLDIDRRRSVWSTAHFVMSHCARASALHLSTTYRRAGCCVNPVIKDTFILALAILGRTREEVRVTTQRR